MRRTLAILLFSLYASIAHAESAGGVSWTAPARWKADPPRPMRVATYKVAAASGDPEDAELAIFYFGPGQGGTVDDNIKRWAGQFEGAKPPAPKKQKQGALEVTRVELEGTYASSMGPMGPQAEKAPKTGYKLLGAIVEGGDGAVFFKLTGPKKTVDGARAELDRMLRSLKK